MLFICVFVASNLQLKANGEQKYKQDVINDCAICTLSFYLSNDQGRLIDAQGKIIPVDSEGQLINESDRPRLVPFDSLEIITLPCGHRFHNTDDCFKGHLTSGRSNAYTCPMCRRPHSIQQQMITQNAIIAILNNTNINCKILTQEGFGEVKPFLRNHHEFVNLQLKLPQGITTIPEYFFVGLTHLQKLFLSKNRLTSLPPSIGRLTSLQKLFLSNNKLTSLPPEIGQLRSLRELFLSNNRLTELPAEIRNLTSLQKLSLSNNRLTSLPPEIGQLRSLRELFLSNNRLTELPAEIENLTSLERLNLGSNRLAYLPPEIGHLRELTKLSLSNNRLTELPAEIENLTNLQVLDLWNNQLTELPGSIVKLNNLTFLNLMNNHLTSFPAEIGRLTSLKFLDLQDNRLTSLPEIEIGQLSSLKMLFLNNNHLVPWPTSILQPLLDKTPPTKISGKYFQTISFSKKIRNLFERRIRRRRKDIHQ